MPRTLKLCLVLLACGWTSGRAFQVIRAEAFCESSCVISVGETMNPRGTIPAGRPTALRFDAGGRDWKRLETGGDALVRDKPAESKPESWSNIKNLYRK